MASIRYAWPGIMAALNTGHSLKRVCERLNADGIAVEYNAFRAYVSILRRQQTQRSVAVQDRQARSAPVPGPVRMPLSPGGSPVKFWNPRTLLRYSMAVAIESDRFGRAVAGTQDAPGYYGTPLHELAHWTGHPSRLDRATLNETYRLGDISYAKEELRAELASVFLAAERGIPHNPEQHAAYLSSWINVLKQDKNEIFRAAHDASRAADFLLALERDRSIAGELGGLPKAVLEREAKNRERNRRDREAGPALAADGLNRNVTIHNIPEHQKTRGLGR